MACLECHVGKRDGRATIIVYMPIGFQKHGCLVGNAVEGLICVHLRHHGFFKKCAGFQVTFYKDPDLDWHPFGELAAEFERVMK